MPTPYRPIRYRRNTPPNLLGGRRGNIGPKTFDEQSGFPCYEGDIVLDEFGTRVDARDTTFDVNHQEEDDRE